MSVAVWDVIWIVLGGLYVISGILWGIIVWRDRPWSLNLLISPGGNGGRIGIKSQSSQRT
jgi:hypothetical protein